MIAHPIKALELTDALIFVIALVSTIMNLVAPNIFDIMYKKLYINMLFKKERYSVATCMNLMQLYCYTLT
jgi:hypothetical protein